jgi:hypothetical protein
MRDLPAAGRATPRRNAHCRRRPVVSNGLSFCSIHHRAFDEDLVGIDPGLRVHVSRRLLDDEDGPMLDVLKGFHGTLIEAPSKRPWRPDPERLAVRFERFSDAGQPTPSAESAGLVRRDSRGEAARRELPSALAAVGLRAA